MYKVDAMSYTETCAWVTCVLGNDDKALSRLVKNSPRLLEWTAEIGMLINHNMYIHFQYYFNFAREISFIALYIIRHEFTDVILNQTSSLPKPSGSFKLLKNSDIVHNVHVGFFRVIFSSFLEYV